MGEKEEQNQAMATLPFNQPKFPVTLKFDKVVYSIKTKNSEEKLILKGIRGMVKAGEMMAMLGPSGSGKTTLLTALGGRLGGALSGNITYNDKPFSKAIRRRIGFVAQDDILHPHLTVIETLVYTALLRLPPALTEQEKSQRAESVMTQLGLSKCRDSAVGGPHLRGVSGGERKRVSIGQEMLINPSLLFLDEPTSGLDSTTAQKIVSTLSRLGRTIVMTIHQPSSRLFYMFDKILLLSDGSPLYFGEGSSALDYFSTLGFAPSVAMNPADFLLDLANEDEQGIRHTLVLAYETHLRSRCVVDDLDLPRTQTRGVDDRNKQWCNSWWEEFRVLFRRGLKERKHESFAVLKIMEVLTMAIMSGLLWWQSHLSHVQDQVGLFFFYTVFWGFYPLLQAIFTFPQERMILSKERSSCMYRLSSYFIALTLGDLPMELILPTIFYTITYWMAGLKASPRSFFSGLFILLYSVLCTQGLGLAIGATLMDQKSAITFGSVIMLTSLLAGGFYVQHVPPFIAWIKYLSIPQYMLKLLLASQYKSGETYVCDTNKSRVCLVEDVGLIRNVGLHGHAMSLTAMGVMLVGYRLVAYMALTKVGSIPNRVK